MVRQLDELLRNSRLHCHVELQLYAPRLQQRQGSLKCTCSCIAGF